MGKKIYGVDLSGNVTPLMVRDAIVRCFESAHKEVLDEMNRKNMPKSERDNFEKMQIEMIVASAFENCGADFNNPDKEGIIRALGELSKMASRFRSPEIIKRHYAEIMELVKRMG